MAPSPISWPPSQWWDGDDGDWSSFALRVGSSEQIVRVLPSTAGRQTYVVSPQGCPAGRHGTSSALSCNESRGGLFDATRSSSWQALGNHSLDLEVDIYDEKFAPYGLDTIALGFANSIGGPTLNSQVISALAPRDYYIGVFGLGHQATNISNFTDPLPSFLTTMRNESLIPSLSWAYTAGARYRLKGVFGSLTFGGYDRSRFDANTTVSISLASDITRDLVVGLQSITSITSNHSTTRTQRLLQNPILTFIDSTLPYIYLPLDACQEFEKNFGLAWDSSAGMYWVNDALHQSLISKNLTFTFTIADTRDGGTAVTIALPYASFDLEVKYPFEADTTRYFPLQQAVNESQYTLGRTFLQEAYIIVDYERSNFSISQCLFEESVPEKLIAIPSVTEPVNHFRRDVVIGASVGTASLLLFAALAAFFLIRRWRRKTTAQHNSDATQPHMPSQESRALIVSSAREIDDNSTVRHFHELPDSAKAELLNAKAPSGSGNEMFEMSESFPPGPHELRTSQGPHVMVQKRTADTWKILFPTKKPRKSWTSFASTDDAPCVGPVTSASTQRKEANVDKESITNSNLEAEIISLYVGKSLDLNGSLSPTPISESPQVSPVLESFNKRSSLHRHPQMLKISTPGPGSAFVSPKIRVWTDTATTPEHKHPSLRGVSTSDENKDLLHSKRRAQKG